MVFGDIPAKSPSDNVAIGIQSKDGWNATLAHADDFRAITPGLRRTSEPGVLIVKPLLNRKIAKPRGTICLTVGGGPVHYRTVCAAAVTVWPNLVWANF
jgi:hypothetical protein